MIEAVLSSQKLVIDIPNYVNGRPTAINAQLIKTSIWLIQKNYMQPQEIHNVLVAFEMQCKPMKTTHLPLSEKIMTASLISVGRAIPRSLFIMWCKKCWKFLECSKIKQQGNGGKKEGQGSSQKDTKETDKPKKVEK